MNRSTRHVAAAIAAHRPAGLEAFTTRPQLTEAEEAWAQLAISVELALKASGNNVSGFLGREGIFQTRPEGPFWWENLEQAQAKAEASLHEDQADPAVVAEVNASLAS